MRLPAARVAVALGVGVALAIATLLFWWWRDVEPKRYQGTTQSLRDVPIVSDRLCGLKTAGPIHYNCAIIPSGKRWSCLLSGTLAADSINDMSQGYHLTVLEKSGSASPIEKIVEARGTDTNVLADFPVEDSTVILGQAGSLGNVEVFVRGDGRFTAFIWK
jgi:hypothetical protein